MKYSKKQLFDTVYSISIVAAAYAVNLVIQKLFSTQTLIPMIFVLGIFLISLMTDGYFYGVFSSLISVLLVNFSFTTPFNGFDLFSPVPLFSALIMLTVAILTCTVTKKIREMEKMRAESELEQMRSNLLRAVSHDLRTPLTTIYGSCSAILENHEIISTDQMLKHLSEIKQDSEWLIRMVENLLSVTRLDAKGVNITKTSTVLEELMDSVVAKFSKRYPDVCVKVNIPDSFISIPMDAILIEQVLINILENAVIHAVGMTHISLTVKEISGNAVFEIADDGAGIPQDRLQKLFSGYLPSAKSPTDGTRSNIGIGLSVCATIIKAHGSVIHAENRQEGGALFRFSLKTEDQSYE
jgi:two-component system sensor histidine kinase KdpD